MSNQNYGWSLGNSGQNNNNAPATQYGWNTKVATNNVPMPSSNGAARTEPVSTAKEKDFVCTKIPVDQVSRFNKVFGVSEEPATSQGFEDLRKKCLRSRALYEDTSFPANDSSISYTGLSNRSYQWLRPHEIAKDPQFFVDGFSRFDVQQGDLGNCWLMAAVANLTQIPNLFAQVVPADNSFEENYAGIFHFKFWQYGKWVEVVIDDRLPTKYGKLCYMHSSERNEFWGALLEKAYAKLHGSYDALHGGNTCEAMADFSGGIIEFYDFEQAPPHDLFQIIEKAYQHKSMMSASIIPDPNVTEYETPNGLVKGHAYSLTMAKCVEIETPNTKGKIQLLRLRNPWGNETEWKGAFGDGSPQWRYISQATKEELGLNFDSDGEFWMSYTDFIKNFDRLEICHMCPDSIDTEIANPCETKRFKMTTYDGEWRRGATAGGCRNYLDTFWINPQYVVSVNETDFEQDTCTVIIALMQKYRRSRKNIKTGSLTIGYAIYKIEEKHLREKPLKMDFFKSNASYARSPTFINLLEITTRFKFPVGHYLIVPSTFEPHTDGEFLIRIYTKSRNSMATNELDWKAGQTQTRLSFQISEPKIPARDMTTLEQVFQDLAGEDKEVDWMELRKILDHTMKDVLPEEGFSKDICRSMVAMLDKDQSGMLGFEEFKQLLTDLAFWKSVFKRYLTPGKFNVNGYQLRDALGTAGYYINYKLLNALVHRFGSKEGKLDFDDFVICAMKVKTMTEAFKEKVKSNPGEATFTLDEWICKAVYS